MTSAQHWIAPTSGDLDVLQYVTVDLAAPKSGEVSIDVRAAGMNPADYKSVARGGFSAPLPVGYEISGVVRELGPDTELASGGGKVGDEVLAFRIHGGYATRVTVAAKDVFAKPATLDHPSAANLLLAGSTAAEMLHVVGADRGDTIVLHGASGAVGVSVLQQARRRGIRVIGTASAASFATVERFGGVPVTYGDGLLGRCRALAPEGFSAALDAVGTDEAVDVSLELVSDPKRIVTIAAMDRAEATGIVVIGGAMPHSAAFRDRIRPELIALAASGDLVVPVAQTFPLDEAVKALTFLREGHPGGKLALIP